jgi:hypothetical protein
MPATSSAAPASKCAVTTTPATTATVAELDKPLALDFDLAYAGFEEDLDEVLASGDPLGLSGHGADDGDELPAAEAFPVSRPGDLWVCGPHRVLCGNAS